MGEAINKSLNVDYNLDYLVIVPKIDEEFFEAFTFTFGNTLLFDNTVEDLEFVIKFLKKNIVGQLIFVDYYAEYNEIINTLTDEHEIKFIFTKGLGKLSDTGVLDIYENICEKYDDGIIHEIGFLDSNLQKVVYKKRRNTKCITLDIERRTQPRINESNYVGLLNDGFSDYDSFYNELCGVSLLDNTVKVYNPSQTALDFMREYGIKAKVVKNRSELIKGNACNLNVNFADDGPLEFIKSMDMGVPCIVGNSYYLINYPELSKYLVMKSDDDPNEIAEKVKNCIGKKKDLLKNYEKFRKDYSKKSSELANLFLGRDVRNESAGHFEKLLTVVVPVYNTEKYLARCLDSIIDAEISNMEVLIIDDGSTDGSDRIIDEYQKSHPKLIRSIRQKNGGLGHVRNVGLKEAKGKYVASVDSDDMIDPDFLRSAILYMKKDVDIVICDWLSISKVESFETAALDYVFKQRRTVEGLLYTTIMPSTCNKIIKKSLYNGLKFLEQKYEDLSVNPAVLLKAKTIKYIHKPYYRYYLSDNSLMRSRIISSEMVDAISYLESSIKKMPTNVNLEEFRYYTYSWRIEEYILNPLYDLKDKELEEAIGYINKKLYKIINEIFGSSYYEEMLDKLKSEELSAFIRNRNKAFRKRKLDEFIMRTKKPQKLTPSIIYYGD